MRRVLGGGVRVANTPRDERSKMRGNGRKLLKFNGVNKGECFL